MGVRLYRKTYENRADPFNTGGFTLIETLVMMAVLGVVLGLVYSTFFAQSRSNTNQAQVVAMQQGARAGLAFMSRSIRMAGIDPDGTRSFGFFNGDNNVSSDALTNSTVISFRFDDDEDGAMDDGEATSFRLSGGQVQQLVFEAGSGSYVWEPLLDDVDALNFVYLRDTGVVIANPSGDLDLIRTVQITLIARTAGVIRGETDSGSYTNKQGTVILQAQNDSVRRLRLSTTVRCRNMGLN